MMNDKEATVSQEKTKDQIELTDDAHVNRISVSDGQSEERLGSSNDPSELSGDGKAAEPYQGENQSADNDGEKVVEASSPTPHETKPGPDVSEPEAKDEITLIKDELNKLEKEKSKLLDEVKRINKKIKYKELELKALTPIVEQYKEVNIDPIRRRLNAIEFKISTQALTPKKERELVKRAKELRKQYNELMKIVRVKKRKSLIEKDLEELNKRRDEIDAQLKELRERIKQLVNDLKEAKKKQRSRGGKPGKKPGLPTSLDDMYYVTLEDIVEIEKK